MYAKERREIIGRVTRYMGIRTEVIIREGDTEGCGRTLLRPE
jgi:hypothetical protein